MQPFSQRNDALGSNQRRYPPWQHGLGLGTRWGLDEGLGGLGRIFTFFTLNLKIFKGKKLGTPSLPD